ncbi:uncharacterized protein DUF1194 [Stella humosa]|uniref:Uncharacterized protein DUF1194 n=1 Tax=Stella humosa TaxID=94 RepID=A0A3N1KQJ9_9PROT|nr:DUF1194 domain-containing protein [Stella humosa]ROP81069.1 uncharacterized protein DUF1194 [Stella humosa]BBK29759.1 hypothetical protein STHU_03930 [Stella humosa]
MRLSGIIAAILLALSWGDLARAAGEPVDLELVLAVDVSGSVDAVEARLQREGYVAAFRDPEVVRAIRSGMVGRIAVLYFEWASQHESRVVLDWQVVADAGSATAFADRLASEPVLRGRRTSIAAAIDFAVPHFGRRYEGTRRVIDLSGDGPNNDGAPVVPARDRAVAAGIVINGLPIINERQFTWGLPNLKELDLYYRDCVIGGPGAFYIVAEDFESFAAAVKRKLVLEIAGRMPTVQHAQLYPERPMFDAEGRVDCLAGEKLLEIYRRRTEPN